MKTQVKSNDFSGQRFITSFSTPYTRRACSLGQRTVTSTTSDKLTDTTPLMSYNMDFTSDSINPI